MKLYSLKHTVSVANSRKSFAISTCQYADFVPNNLSKICALFGYLIKFPIIDLGFGLLLKHLV